MSSNHDLHRDGPEDGIRETLRLSRPSGRHRKSRWLLLLGALALAALGLWWGCRDRRTEEVTYRTQPARRGDLTVSVTATGTLQPVNQVEVGSEVSGIIEEVAVDFNDLVNRGQVLARLDTDLLEARVAQGQANLEAARAGLLRAEATRVESRSQARRAEELARADVATRQDLETAQASLQRAEADVASARAQIAVQESALASDRTSLAKAVVRSPIDGVVLSRSVEPGQTVAASFQTPVLFTLAEDLRRMELVVEIDEADIGDVEEGQAAEFTVDAFPDRKFPARLTSLRNAPKTVQDVVTYEGILEVANDDLALRPGMTATAEIVTRQVEDALLVPNAALRFSPTASTSTPRRAGPPNLFTVMRERKTDGARPGAKAAAGPSVWFLAEGQLQAIPVTLGLTDGRFTEVVGGDLQPGTELVVEASRP
ncbi:MAG: efflux RND transporter periplasmic adaptor subunit [Acidobacteria bacterium]|nr:efflux RND transporter periplasmic adaptor subunit [Acidobacteriota bacterium]